MHAAVRLTDDIGRMLQVLQPPDTLFGFDRHSRRIDGSFQGVSSFKLAACPELDGGQAERQSLRRDRQAGVHQHAADCMLPWASIFLPSRESSLGDANSGWRFPGKRKLGRVMQDQDRTIDRRARSRVAWKCPARMPASFTRRLPKKR